MAVAQKTLAPELCKSPRAVFPYQVNFHVPLLTACCPRFCRGSVVLLVSVQPGLQVAPACLVLMIGFICITG